MLARLRPLTPAAKAHVLSAALRQVRNPQARPPEDFAASQLRFARSALAALAAARRRSLEHLVPLAARRRHAMAALACARAFRLRAAARVTARPSRRAA